MPNEQEKKAEDESDDEFEDVELADVQAPEQAVPQQTVPQQTVIVRTPPTYKALFSELNNGLVCGLGFTAGTICIISGGLSYASRGPVQAEAIAVITGVMYPTSTFLFPFANAIPLLANGDIERTLQLRTASHVANIGIGVIQNLSLLAFVYAAGERLYGQEVNDILTDYVIYNLATLIILLLNNNDIQISIVKNEKYPILLRELCGIVTGLGLNVVLNSQHIYGTYFLPVIDFTQQITAYLENQIYLKVKHSKTYTFANLIALKKDIIDYLKKGLPSVGIEMGKSISDMIIILFLQRMPDFLSGYQIATFLTLPVQVTQSIFESVITYTLINNIDFPNRVLASSTALSLVLPSLTSIGLGIGYDYFTQLIAGEDNPVLMENMQHLLPFTLAQTFLDAIRSTLTGLLRGFDDQNVPALLNILITLTFTVTAIGAVAGDAPPITLNIFRNLLAPFCAGAVLAVRYYNTLQNEPTVPALPAPRSCGLRFLSMFGKATRPNVTPVINNTARVVEVIDDKKTQEPPKGP